MTRKLKERQKETKLTRPYTKLSKVPQKTKPKVCAISVAPIPTSSRKLMSAWMGFLWCLRLLKRQRASHVAAVRSPPITSFACTIMNIFSRLFLVTDLQARVKLFPVSLSFLCICLPFFWNYIHMSELFMSCSFCGRKFKWFFVDRNRHFIFRSLNFPSASL